MMKDSIQKDKLSKHFGKQGLYSVSEIPVYFHNSIERKPREFTDIDVLAIRPGNHLKWELILGDCKTLKNQSPINRALWLKGLMDYYDASSGFIILGNMKNISRDHKLFASKINIMLLREDEFDQYDKSIIYPSGSSSYSVSNKELNKIRHLYQRFPRIKPMTNYLFKTHWNEGSRVDIIRNLIGQLKGISTELDPKNDDHIALFLEACGVFSIGLAECVGTIFSEFLKPRQKTELEEALKLLIWGGRSQYEFISELRNKIMLGKKLQKEELTLPEWNIFTNLFRGLLENPKLNFDLPYIFQKASIDLQNGNKFLSYSQKEDLLLIKNAMLIATYLCKASPLPNDFLKKIQTLFGKRQSELAHIHIEKQ